MLIFCLFLYLTRAIENSAKFSKVKSIIFFLCNQYGFKILGRGNSSVLRFTKHYHKYYVSISVNVLVCYGHFKICSNGPSSFLAKQRNENLNISFLASNLPEVGFHIFYAIWEVCIHCHLKRTDVSRYPLSKY